MTMLEYVEVNPTYQVHRRGKWRSARQSSNDKNERTLAFYTHRWARVCASPEEKEAFITEKTARAQSIIEHVKQEAKNPDRYRLANISTSTTNIPRSWRLAQAVKELGGAELKIYLDESGLSEIDNLSEMLSAAINHPGMNSQAC